MALGPEPSSFQWLCHNLARSINICMPTIRPSITFLWNYWKYLLIKFVTGTLQKSRVISFLKKDNPRYRSSGPSILGLEVTKKQRSNTFLQPPVILTEDIKIYMTFLIVISHQNIYSVLSSLITQNAEELNSSTQWKSHHKDSF